MPRRVIQLSRFSFQILFSFKYRSSFKFGQLVELDICYVIIYYKNCANTAPNWSQNGIFQSTNIFLFFQKAPTKFSKHCCLAKSIHVESCQECSISAKSNYARHQWAVRVTYVVPRTFNRWMLHPRWCMHERPQNEWLLKCEAIDTHRQTKIDLFVANIINWFCKKAGFYFTFFSQFKMWNFTAVWCYGKIMFKKVITFLTTRA